MFEDIKQIVLLANDSYVDFNQEQGKDEDFSGMTAFMLAAERCTSCLQSMIETKRNPAIDIGYVNWKGETVFHIAARNNKHENIKILVELAKNIESGKCSNRCGI